MDKSRDIRTRRNRARGCGCAHFAVLLVLDVHAGDSLDACTMSHLQFTALSSCNSFSFLWTLDVHHLFCKSSTSRLRSSKDVSISYFHGATLWQSNLPSWDDRLLFRVAMNAYRGRLHIWRHFNIFFKLLGWRRCSPRVLQQNIHRTSQRQLRLYNLLGHLNWVLQSFGLPCGVRYLLKTELQFQTNAADAGNFDSCTSLLSKETWAGADKNEHNKTCTINGRHSHNERHFVDSSLYFKSSTSVTNMRTWPATHILSSFGGPSSKGGWKMLKTRVLRPSAWAVFSSELFQMASSGSFHSWHSVLHSSRISLTWWHVMKTT